MMSFKIIGTGSYVPEHIVTNDDLASIVDTSDEWITQRVGVHERRVSVNETAADLAYKAALNALSESGVKPTELDLIIAASISGETLCPTVAGFVQSKLGATCPAFDINSACSGFLFALDVAAGFYARGNVKKALIIGAERLSKIIDWKDRSTCVIFGDGAGAVVTDAGDNYLSSKICTKGGSDVIEIPSFSGSSPFYESPGKSPYIFMQGQETFKFAVNAMTEDVKEVVSKANLSLDDIKYFIPHQANIRIIQFASKKLGIPIDKFVVNIEKYGNTSAASVPMALDQINKSGNLNRGDLLALSAFGGGLSSAASIIRW
ncbi:MAG: beta-ketoacyl-ACP synthase III [Bacillota bacterium]|nr:beta-ketoacyl-ACP synthase III [Bacillota bacterium]